MRFVSFFYDRISTSKGALRPHRKGKVSMKRTKLLALLTSISCILLTIVLVGSYFTAAYAMMINKELGIVTTSVVTDDPSKNATYYASSFLKEDGTRDDDALTAWQKALCEQIQGEGSVLLTNNGALPMEKGLGVTVFGRGAVDTIYGGTGSGQVDTSKAATMTSALTAAGLNVNTAMMDWYSAQIAQMKEDKTNRSTPGMFTEYADVPAATRIAEVSADAVASSGVNLDGYKDAAIVVIGRSGGEGADLYTGEFTDGTSYFELQDSERELLKYVASQGFSKTIVLINSSNAMAMDWVNNPEYGVDACLWIGGPGQYGLNAVAQILVGNVNPSGRLVDTYSVSSLSSAAIQNFGSYVYTNADEETGTVGGVTIDGVPGDKTKVRYAIHYLVESEGIYVGYKYYETAADDMNAENPGSGDEWYDSQVLYPYGYGLSYTTFDWELMPAADTAITDPFQKLSMQVKVTNTGDVAGKEVVQVYANPPYTKGGIEKASANLVGFAKTDLLQPGQSQTVTVDWVAQDMASYDWNDANANGYTGYELEAGDYVITARSNSHDVKLSETYTVAAGMNCTTDYITGNEIESLFVDDFTSVNDSLLSGMISRATGLTQPAPASKTDREISDDTLATLDGQYSYRSYMDQGYEEWFVNEDGIPSTWTQAATRTEGEKAPISIMDMAGIDFSLKIEDGEVVQGDDEGSQKWEAFMNQLTWEEMASLVNNGGGVKAIDAVDVVGAGVNETPLQLSGGTLWACPPILAATFNLDLAEEVGVMMGNEALFKGCSYWQGNAMNIHRSPLSGRNVEYYSQDGVHGGKFAAAVVAGVTSKGVTCHIKHMVLNDQESYRDLNGGVSTWATEQVIREIYAKPFEYALKVGRSTGVMSSFNRIGLVNSQLNLAMHKLVRNEWSNRAIFETDAWQGTYCPLDLMVRQGDNQVLGAGTTLPDIGLEIGAWDADGNCVRVSDGAEGTFLSQTHYAAVRRSAQEILWNYANSSAVHNGYIGFEPCVLEFDSYAAQSLPISFGDVDIATITLADGAQLPEGFTMSDAGVVTSDGSLAEGEWTIDIKLNGIDGYITLGAQAVIRVVDALHVSTTSLKVGEAANVTVDAPYYAYESLVKVNPRFVSTVKHTDGTPVAQGEMQGFGGKTILPGTGDSVGGTLRIQNWYWKDASQVQGNNYDGLGALAFADIEATDARYLETADVEAGNYYQAYLYEFRVSDEDAAKLAEYGLTAEKVMAPVTAYQGITYDYNSALAITGTPTKAGEVEITVTLQIPLVRGFGSRFPNNVHVGSPTATKVTRTFTLTIGE